MKLSFEVKSSSRTVTIELADDPEWKCYIECGTCYEPEVVNAMLRFVKPGDFAIDCGANLGFFTAMLSKLVGPTGEVLAFEPDPKFFPRLQANLALNGADNVQAFDTVLWHQDEEDLNFHLTEKAGYSSVLQFMYGIESSVTVTARSLDSLVIDDVPFRCIKIDCEGSEERILHGAERLLRTGVDCVIIELNPHLMPHMDTSEAFIRDYMHSLGYDFFLLNPYGDKPMLLRSDETLASLIGEDKYKQFMFNVLFSTEAKVDKAWSDVSTGS